MRARRRPVGLATALLAAALVLGGCGSSDVRDFIDDTYDRQGSQGDTATYLAGTPVGATTAAIVAAADPAARRADGGSEYLRYADDIVVVSAAAAGSTVRVEDIDGDYRRGRYSYLGPEFRPGSPVGDSGSGGPGDVK